jgi:hypothetical protein
MPQSSHIRETYSCVGPVGCGVFGCFSPRSSMPGSDRRFGPRLDSHDNRGVSRHERSIEDCSRAGWTCMMRMRRRRNPPNHRARPTARLKRRDSHPREAARLAKPLRRRPSAKHPHPPGPNGPLDSPLSQTKTEHLRRMRTQSPRSALAPNRLRERVWLRRVQESAHRDAQRWDQTSRDTAPPARDLCSSHPQPHRPPC